MNKCESCKYAKIELIDIKNGYGTKCSKLEDFTEVNEEKGNVCDDYEEIK